MSAANFVMSAVNILTPIVLPADAQPKADVPSSPSHRVYAVFSPTQAESAPKPKELNYGRPSHVSEIRDAKTGTGYLVTGVVSADALRHPAFPDQKVLGEIIDRKDITVLEPSVPLATAKEFARLYREGFPLAYKA